MKNAGAVQKGPTDFARSPAPAGRRSNPPYVPKAASHGIVRRLPDALAGTRKSIIVTLWTAAGLFLLACGQSPVAEMKFPEGTVQHVVYAEEIQWQPCPPNLPSGCEIAVLEGSPRRPELFTVRFRVGEGFVMPPHSHPRHERVTVLTGSMAVAFGLDGTRESATEFGPGDYYVNAPGATHTVWADTTSVIQITGIGPWEARFVQSSTK